MVIVLIVLVTLVSFSYANQCKEYKDFYNDHERGWFYKEICEEKKLKKKSKKDTQKQEYRILASKTVYIPWDKLDNLDPDEIYKIYLNSRKIAVMYPTRHNVKELQKLNIWMTEKGYKFMEEFIKVVKTDTEIARYASAIPVSGVGRDTYLKAEAQYRKQVLQQFKDKAGLVVVVKQGCPYCERQKIILKWFAMETGWTYRLVDVSQVPNMVKKFGIARTPDIFLVLNKNGKAKWIRIATGLHSQPELERAVLFGLYMLKEINPDEKSFVLY